MSNWLITGGAGFIGSNIAQELLSRKEKVRVLDNFSTGFKKNLQDFVTDIEIIEGDVRDTKICEKSVSGIDYVLHQAALGSVPRSIAEPLVSHECNATGTLNMLVASKEAGVKRFVCAGSSSVYGKNPSLPKKENMQTMPISPYAVTKLAQESYCLAFQACYQMETVVLRYFNIFGQKQDPNSLYAAVIPKFFKAAIEGYPPEIHGDGEQSRDFTFVSDCVEANIKAATTDLFEQRVFNIAGGKRVTINEIWQNIKKITGSKVNADYIDPRAGDVRHSLADTDFAREYLKWEPKVSVEEGLKIIYERQSA